MKTENKMKSNQNFVFFAFSAINFEYKVEEVGLEFVQCSLLDADGWNTANTQM